MPGSLFPQDRRNIFSSYDIRLRCFLKELVSELETCTCLWTVRGNQLQPRLVEKLEWDSLAFLSVPLRPVRASVACGQSLRLWRPQHQEGREGQGLVSLWGGVEDSIAGMDPWKAGWWRRWRRENSGELGTSRILWYLCTNFLPWNSSLNFVLFVF